LSLALQSDGKVLVGGDLSTVNGIARLNSNGSLDNSFAAGTGANGSVRSVVVHSDGKVVIGGPFCEVNGTYRNGIARLNADGGVDTSFNPGTGASGVEAIALHSNGQVFIGGYFTSVNGTNRNRIARLNADGSLDGSFHPGTGVANPVSSLVLQPDGKVLIGDVTFTNGTSGYGSARLNADGSVDSAFISAGFYPDWSLFYVTCQPEHTCEDTFTVTAAAVQPDGKVMVDGVYHHFGYDPSGYYSPEEYTFYALARFNADGSLDRSFNPVEGNPSVLAFQSDGKMLIGGGPFANGTNYTSISRLYSDGGLDTNFQREYNRL
jgi:uncharacterized delta-60 repeat protein